LKKKQNTIFFLFLCIVIVRVYIQKFDCLTKNSQQKKTNLNSLFCSCRLKKIKEILFISCLFSDCIMDSKFI